MSRVEKQERERQRQTESFWPPVFEWKEWTHLFEWTIITTNEITVTIRALLWWFSLHTDTRAHTLTHTRLYYLSDNKRGFGFVCAALRHPVHPVFPLSVSISLSLKGTNFVLLKRKTGMWVFSSQPWRCANFLLCQILFLFLIFLFFIY